MLLRRTILAATLLLPQIAAAQSGLIQVTGVRSWSHPDATRIIIETSGPFEYRSDRATEPERFFVDILKARPWIQKHRVAAHAVNDALVRRVRVAETSPGTTRIVFDLTAQSEATLSTLDTPNRLVIEFRPKKSSAPQRPVRSLTTSMRRWKPFLAPPAPVPPALALIALAPPPPVLDPLPLQAVNLRFSSPALVPARRAPALTSARQISESTIATSKVLPPTHSALADTALPSEDANRSLIRALGLKINRIVIDAGHGGHDDGTMGPHGVLEKDVVLDVALRLSNLVQERLGAEVVLTRSDDTFVPLQERTALANQHKADLFVSIHANSSPSPIVAGTETFFLNFTSSPGAMDVAARENSGSEKSVGELKDLIQQISLNEKITESQTFAQTIERTLAIQAGKSNPAAHDRGVKRAPFVVLIGAAMPSILAEIGFLSNARDEANLGKPEYRQKIAEALFKGVSEYTQSLSHFEVARQ